MIYGPEGIGKTTFATHFPDPLYCDTEGGSHNIDVARTPVPTSWSMLLATVKEIIADPTLCRTFVLDTADWAERLCVKHVCDAHGQSGVESFGYGKGYVYVYEEFGRLLDLLSTLIERGVNVVVTAHAQLRKFEQPDELGSYDRYELKLTDKSTGAKTASMLKEWADLLLFANYKTIVVNVDGQGAAKGKNKAQGNQRVMYATHTPQLGTRRTGTGYRMKCLSTSSPFRICSRPRLTRQARQLCPRRLRRKSPQRHLKQSRRYLSWIANPNLLHHRP